MSKIEEYHEAKRVAERVETAYLRATGKDSPQNDKHRIVCESQGLKKDMMFNPALLSFTASYGTYGQSGSYSVMDAQTAEYVAKAITAMGNEIMQRAATLAAVEAEKARRDAEAEARAVLAQVAP